MAITLSARWVPIVNALGVDRPGDVGWVHGANSTQELIGALSDPAVHFIEGDISEVDGKIIMAHPPVTDSDLDFERWLDLTISSGKGAKLDFKSPQAVAHCLTYAERHAAGKIPLCANADILPGPAGGPPSFNPKEFLSLCKELLPQAFLSLGWTVEAGGTGYTSEMLAAMRELLVQVKTAVTICFYAGYLREDWPNLKGILEETDYTITVWGKIEDPALVSWIRANTPPERCFYDVQRGDGSQIHITSL